METHLTYFLILATSLFFPLILSFDKKVSFRSKWKYAFSAMIVPAIFYIVWDIYMTANQAWSFNPEYITGVMVYNLPLEEVLFFFIVPYCCLFIYECIRSYFENLADHKVSYIILALVAIALMVTRLFFMERLYTSTTFLFAGTFILILVFFKKWFKSFHATAFLISYVIILIPFLIVNGFLTAIPVVEYNDMENLGIRIYTIPIEDIFYGMLLIMLNVIIYERLMKRTNPQHLNT